MEDKIDRRALFPVLIMLLFTFSAPGQEAKGAYQPVSVQRALKQQLIPAGLLAASLILSLGDVRQEIQEWFPDTHTGIDDWLRYGPVVQLLAFDLLLPEPRNTLAGQAGYLLMAYAATSSMVQVLKEATGQRRPSGGIHAYPSGHTAFAFTGATLLYHEFRETHPVLAASGYLFATATGILRITNDAHWLPDVLAGAGLSILLTNLVYQSGMMEKWQLSINKNGLEIIPGISENGLVLNILF